MVMAMLEMVASTYWTPSSVARFSAMRVSWGVPLLSKGKISILLPPRTPPAALTSSAAARNCFNCSSKVSAKVPLSGAMNAILTESAGRPLPGFSPNKATAIKHDSFTFIVFPPLLRLRPAVRWLHRWTLHLAANRRQHVVRRQYGLGFPSVAGAFDVMLGARLPRFDEAHDENGCNDLMIFGTHP